MDSVSGRDVVRSALVLGVVWIAMVALTGPTGDFPLADDWNYGASVRTVLTEHRYAPPVYTEAALVAQTAYGALVCSVFGFSFTTLRLATLFLGWCGGVAIYVTARAAGARDALALLCALFAITSPLYFALASTFMTDIPYFAFGSAGVAALAVALGSNRISLFAIGVVLIALSTLTRQVGLTLALACGLGYLTTRRPSRQTMLMSALPLAVAGAAFGAYVLYLRSASTPSTLVMFRAQQLTSVMPAPTELMSRLAMGVIATLLYVGLLVAPFAAVGTLATRSAGAIRQRAMPIVGATAALLLLFWWRNKFLPVTGDFLTVNGVGGMTLAGTAALPQIGMAWRVALTVVATLTSAWIFWRAVEFSRMVVQALRRDGRLSAQTGVRLICLAAIVCYVPLILPSWVYDRYLIPVICLALIFIAPPEVPRLGRPVLAIAAVLLAVQAAVAVAGTHDYLAWNRARWQAAADWAAEGRSMDLFDAGREVNAWVSYDPAQSLEDARTTWNRERATVRLAFGCEPGAAIVREYPYRTWLFPGRRSLCLMQIDRR